jgi:hypothetical protein
VWMFHRLCAHEGRTSNQQRRSNGCHSEIAHRIPQRQNPALAVVACAARTTVAREWTLRADRQLLRFGNFFPFPIAPRSVSVRQDVSRGSLDGGRPRAPEPGSTPAGVFATSRNARPNAASDDCVRVLLLVVNSPGPSYPASQGRH